ncbi:sister chromatid cohesion protein PDS5 homologA-A [Striga asiatica]|uniref:Sister chromatid cohesion protein PDS5 homologA-A n=1 Tax=Striga asiatica TaxID=4170 RepID=A0A5A7R5G3_STRAF|nr:sister chromatid cohesion protein PDS5 homologA-A [Striga asiatica]
MLAQTKDPVTENREREPSWSISPSHSGQRPKAAGAAPDPFPLSFTSSKTRRSSTVVNNRETETGTHRRTTAPEPLHHRTAAPEQKGGTNRAAPSPHRSTGVGGLDLGKLQLIAHQGEGSRKNGKRSSGQETPDSETQKPSGRRRNRLQRLFSFEIWGRRNEGWFF